MYLVPRACAWRLEASYLHDIQVTEPRMESNIRDAYHRHTQLALAWRLLGQGSIWQGLLGRVRNLGGRNILKRSSNKCGMNHKFEVAMVAELTTKIA